MEHVLYVFPHVTVHQHIAGAKRKLKNNLKIIKGLKNRSMNKEIIHQRFQFVEQPIVFLCLNI